MLAFCILSLQICYSRDIKNISSTNKKLCCEASKKLLPNEQGLYNVSKQLPGDLSKNAIEKRIERGRKVYDLFSDIGYDKIQLIKSFSASQIYKLSWDDRDTIEAEFEQLLRHSHVTLLTRGSEKSKCVKINSSLSFRLFLSAYVLTIVGLYVLIK